MKIVGNIALLLLVALSLTSCLVTESSKTLRVEIMKPGIITLPNNIDTIALVNRSSYFKDSIPFKYFNGKVIIADTTIKFKAISDTCVSALAGFLKDEGYFKEVINYRDNPVNKWFFSNGNINNPAEIFQKTKSDICIFLDFLNFNVAAFYGLEDVTTNLVALSWKIAIKNDSLIYQYNQVDTLIYDPVDSPVIMSGQKRLQILVNNSSQYLGKFFGTKIIPNWVQVDRLYYKSNNPNMILAEKYALENDWLKAAEIWNVQTKNKNPKIAAKASFNMALASEMEGKPDIGIDWLVRSHEFMFQNNEEHRANCQRYITVLALRKKEIEKLQQQLRNN